MSIYVTEFPGYYVELWKNAPISHVRDPLGFLYGEGTELLRRICGKNLFCRRMEIARL